MKVNLDENRTFCLAPWIHTYLGPSGDRLLCCTFDDNPFEKNAPIEEIWNSEYYRDVRKKMMNGDIIKGCERCPIDKSLPTYRDYWNGGYTSLIDAVIEKTDENGFFPNFPITIDYRTSKCNFKCKMCNPFFSTSIFNEYKKTNRIAANKEKDLSFLWQNRDELVEKEIEFLIDNELLTEIYWAGGEPLISDIHWKTLIRLIETNQAKNIKLRYTTNLSNINYKKYDLAKLFSEFKEVELFCSIDGTSHIGEWVRTGFDYEKWISNYEHLTIKNNIHSLHTTLMITVTLPTLLDLPNLNILADKYDLDLNMQKAVGTLPLLMVDKYPFDIIKNTLIEVKEKVKQQNSKNTPRIIEFIDENYIENIHFDDYSMVIKKDEYLDEIKYLEKHRGHSQITFKDIVKQEPNIYNFLYEAKAI